MRRMPIFRAHFSRRGWAMSAASTSSPPPLSKHWYKGVYGSSRWPQAAQTVWEFFGPFIGRGKFTVTATDLQIAQWCGIRRRCVQKGLKQLEDMGLISRRRQHGHRVITIECPQVKPSAKDKDKGGNKGSPSTPASSRKRLPIPNLQNDRPVTPEEEAAARAAAEAINRPVDDPIDPKDAAAAIRAMIGREEPPGSPDQRAGP